MSTITDQGPVEGQSGSKKTKSVTKSTKKGKGSSPENVNEEPLTEQKYQEYIDEIFDISSAECYNRAYNRYQVGKIVDDICKKSKYGDDAVNKLSTDLSNKGVVSYSKSTLLKCRKLYGAFTWEQVRTLVEYGLQVNDLGMLAANDTPKELSDKVIDMVKRDTLKPKDVQDYVKKERDKLSGKEEDSESNANVDNKGKDQSEQETTEVTGDVATQEDAYDYTSLDGVEAGAEDVKPDTSNQKDDPGYKQCQKLVRQIKGHLDRDTEKFSAFCKQIQDSFDALDTDGQSEIKKEMNELQDKVDSLNESVDALKHTLTTLS